MIDTDNYAVLRIRDFRLMLGSRFFVTLALQMQALVVGWQVFKLTNSALALGLIGLAEAIPIMGCSLWAGHLADRVDKQRMIQQGQGGLVLCSAVLLALSLSKRPSVLLIYLVIGLTGLFRTLLWSSTISYTEMSVPREIYSKAVAWTSTLWQIAAVVGPAVGGWIYSLWDAPLAYTVIIGFLVIAVLQSSRLSPKPPVVRTSSPASGEPTEDPSNFLSGVRFVFSQPVIWGALSLDMFAVLFGGATALLPIFAEMLHVGPSGLGLLRAAPAFGALLMSIYQAHRPPFRKTGQVFLRSVAIFGLCMVAFALAKQFVLCLIFLAVSGMADNVSVVVRASILQAFTPDHLRGRVSSVNGVFVSSSNEIGAFESGVVANLMGTVPSVVFGGLMTLVIVALSAWWTPELRRLKMGELSFTGRDGILRGEAAGGVERWQ
ncbi:MAG: MFS transporter [Elusimicrobia bacterium]|nr:MFS transporter [Elusimicrobiota bacterium]